MYTPGVLIFTIFAVGVLHTLVPDHWAPITLIARQRGWTLRQTARAAAGAGLGHVVSTLIIAIVVWLAGVAFAQRFGDLVNILTSAALIAFGGWVAIGALREVREAKDASVNQEQSNSLRVDTSATSSRTALLLILGSSPMVEGIPAFFAASRYGIVVIAVMSIVFAISTIATYVVLCVTSVRGMQNLNFGPIEQYGEVISGSIIALLGIVFLFVR